MKKFTLLALSAAIASTTAIASDVNFTDQARQSAVRFFGIFLIPFFRGISPCALGRFSL